MPNTAINNLHLAIQLNQQSMRPPKYKATCHSQHFSLPATHTKRFLNNFSPLPRLMPPCLVNNFILVLESAPLWRERVQQAANSRFFCVLTFPTRETARKMNLFPALKEGDGGKKLYVRRKALIRGKYHPAC